LEDEWWENPDIEKIPDIVPIRKVHIWEDNTGLLLNKNLITTVSE